MARRLTYWERRAVEEEEVLHRNLNGYEKRIINAYGRAQDYLTKQVQKIYQHHRLRADFTEEEVGKILNTSASQEDIVEIQRLIKSIENREAKKRAQDYLSWLAAKHRITRLETLKAKSHIVANQIAKVQLDVSTNYLVNAVHGAYNQAAAESIIRNTEEIHEIYTKGNFPAVRLDDNKNLKLEIKDFNTDEIVKTINLTEDEKIPEFRELSTKQTKNVLDMHWHGNNYSGRIWNDTEALAKTLEELFTVQAMTGMSQRDMVREIREKFQSSLYVARRLIRTEANFVANQGKLRAWRAHGVKKFIVIAVLDMRTSKVCREHDGEIVEIAKAVVAGKDGNCPPFHPHCRTTISAYFGERTLRGMRFANDPITGETIEIRQRDTYRDWERILLQNHSKKDLEIERTKIKRYSFDRDQWRRYRRAFGDEVPETFDEFQNMKYRESEKYEALKREYVNEARRASA